MRSKSRIEEKITSAMQNAFTSKEERKLAVHTTAAAGAAIVALLPIGLDVWALRVAETVMIVCVAGSYGERLTKSAAKGLLLSSFAQLVGEAVAITSLEAAEASKLLNPFGAYVIKSGVAIGLIEAVGNMAIQYYEKPSSLGAKACSTAEAIGLAADVSRLTTTVANIATGNESDSIANTGTANPMISFSGSKDPKTIEALKKVEECKKKVKTYTEYYDSDIRMGRNTDRNMSNLKDAIKQLENAKREYDWCLKH